MLPRFFLLAWAVLIATTQMEAQGPPLSCTSTVESTPAVRPGEFTARGGDVLVTCTGGNPTLTGTPVPQVNFLIFASTDITSHDLVPDANPWNEALLTIDEPAFANHSVCGAPAVSCPLTGGLMPGGINYADPGSPFNLGQAVRNVYQGRKTAANGVTWIGIPFDPPGSGNHRTIRFTNLRYRIPLTPGTIAVNLSTSTFAIAPSGQNVAVVQAGSTTAELRNAANTALLGAGGLALQQCVDNNAALALSPTSGVAPQERSLVARLSEFFASAFQRRSAAVPAPPATGETPPAPAAQTGILRTETGFYNPALPASNGLSEAGLARGGTRFFLRLPGLPAGVRIYAPVSVPVMAGAAQTGVARMVNAAADGSGAFAATPATSALEGGMAAFAIVGADQQAIYEIVNADEALIDKVDVPIYVAYSSATVGLGAIPMRLGLAPVSTDASSASAIIPRFQDTSVAMTAAAIAACPPPPQPPPPPPPVAPLTIVNETVHEGTVDLFYREEFFATGPGLPFEWSVPAGGLPPGLTMNPATGVLSGTPTQPGDFLFTVVVRDSLGRSASKRFGTTIRARVEILTACPLPAAVFGAAYRFVLTARGGTTPYLWTYFLSRAPAGLTLSADGVLSGMPNAVGVSEFAVQVNDRNNASARLACSLAVAGELTATPASLSFRAISNGPIPPPEVLHLTGTGSGFDVDVVLTTSGGGPWLKATPTSGSAPLLSEIIADPTGVPPGDYTGVAEFRSGGQVLRRVNVSLHVDPPQPPQLTAEPSTVQAAVPAGTARVDRLVRLVNRGSGTINFAGSIEYEQGGQGWLDVSPLSGTVGANTPVLMRLTLRPGAPGTSRARVRLRDIITGRETVVPVLVAVNGGGLTLELSQLGLSFRAVAGAARPPAKSFDVLARGTGTINWTARVLVDAGQPSWLTLSSAGGTTSAGNSTRVDALIDTTGLGAGDYLAEVQVSAPGVPNSPRTLYVSLKVLPAGSDPELDVTPAGLVFVGVAGQSNPASQNVTVFNGGGATTSLEFSLQSRLSPFTVGAPTNLNVAAGGIATFVISASIGNRPPGVYRVTLAIRDSKSKRVTLVDLVLIVVSGTQRTTAVERFAEISCPPGGLQMVSLRQAIGFQSVTGVPMPVEVRVTDTDGRGLTSGVVTALLNGNTSSVASLVHIDSDPGRWSGTLMPPAQSTTPISLRMLAQDVAGTRSGCLDLSGTTENTGAPVIADGGVLSAASFVRGAPLSGGGMASIFGASLAGGSNAAPGFPLPTRLGDTRITIAGQAAPLLFAGDLSTFSQVNAILPYGLAPAVTQQLSLRRGTGQLAIAELITTTAQPAVFTVDQSGAGQGIIVLGANPTLLASLANPVSPGGSVVIYAEGLGPVEPVAQTGEQTPNSPLRRVANPVRVTIGGIEAEVQFAGLTPGFASLYQVNAVVPVGVVAGNAVPVVVTVAGQSSAPVTIAVR